MAKRKMGKSEKKVRRQAKRDPLIKQMLDLYDLGLFKKSCKTFADFSTGLVIVLSESNIALDKHIQSGCGHFQGKPQKSVYGPRSEDC